jgi:hypothetical protein
MWPCRTHGARSIVIGAGGITAIAFARKRMIRWGATDDELGLGLPGDDLLVKADLVSTRGITINATAGEVWPWIVQLGQGRGGFYTYDFLENLVGADIHSADSIVPEWQHVEVGDEVRLAVEVPLIVAQIEPNCSLVLRGAVQMGKVSAPYDFTWAFVLCPKPDGATRLVVRERYLYVRRWAPILVEPTEVISFVMSQRMLRGIKERAERPIQSAAL